MTMHGYAGWLSSWTPGGRATQRRAPGSKSAGPQLRPISGRAVGAAVDGQRRERHRAVHVDRHVGIRRRAAAGRARAAPARCGRPQRPGSAPMPPRPTVRRTASASTRAVGVPGGCGRRRWTRRRRCRPPVGPRRQQQRMVGPAEIAAEEHAWPSTSSDRRSRTRGCDPAGRSVTRLRRRVRRLGVAATGCEERQGALGVGPVVQRQRRVGAWRTRAVGVRRVLLLEVRAVAQHDPRQRGRLARADDRPPKPSRTSLGR